MKDHDREVFYKYVTSDTAKAILKTQTIRWGCPLTFNDPFDTQTEFQVDFMNDAGFVDDFMNILVTLVYGDEEPVFEHQGTLMMSSIIMGLRKIRDRIPKERFQLDTQEGLREGIGNVLDNLKDINKEWSEYISKSRVLCVTEKFDNLLMWAHYAEDHKGLVVELKCLPEYDTALCAAKSIKYVDKMPAMVDKKEFIKDNIGLVQLDKTRLFSDFAFTKSNHWSYEKEWRCFTLSDERKTDTTNSFDTEPLLAEEISAIYLGCKMLEEKRCEILKILDEERYKHVKIFEAIPDKRTFSLIDKRIR